MLVGRWRVDAIALWLIVHGTSTTTLLPIWSTSVACVSKLVLIRCRIRAIVVRMTVGVPSATILALLLLLLGLMLLLLLLLLGLLLSLLSWSTRLLIVCCWGWSVMTGALRLIVSALRLLSTLSGSIATFTLPRSYSISSSLLRTGTFLLRLALMLTVGAPVIILISISLLLRTIVLGIV